MAKTETTTETRNEKNPTVAGRVLKKVSAQQIKLSDKKPGFTFEGKFVSLTKREDEVADQETGEVLNRKLYTMIIEDEKGDRTKFLADAGLRTAFDDASVQPGDWFKAVKGEKVSLGGPKTMNTWDIFMYA